MRALIVGAGAVGQVYAWHLARGGARCAFLVRPRHAETARRGFRLAPLRRPTVNFVDYDVHVAPGEIAERRWGAVILAMSSVGLRQGDWLGAVADAAGEATVVTLQPGLTDPDYVRARVPARRVVAGRIGLLSWIDDDATAFWIPPLARCPFSGLRAAPIVEAFRRGGLPARLEDDVTPGTAFGAALLDIHMAALERAGWRLGELRRDRALLDMAGRAAREATAVVERKLGTRAPRLARQLPVGLALGLAPRLAPLDLEGFFRAHYTKVGAQTRHLLDTYCELAERYALPSPALRELRRGLGPC